jgi:uncharacterized protein YbbC (DUF1343 family)
MLKGIDALVFDIQDVGARFYTYSTTMAYCLEEAAKARIPFFVLDRPNPIGGTSVEGPMLDADKTSFIGYMPLPVRHGMTVGELAGYINAEKKLGADLHVVKMRGWQRSFYLYDTGQVWVNPSPNMRSILAAILYPGVCLLEATNVSVGRGTDRPFEMIGAPWIDASLLAAKLNGELLRGVKFIPLYFTPASSTNQGQRCGGVEIILTEPEKVNAVEVGMTLISNIRRLYPAKFDIDRVLHLMGNESALKALKAGHSPQEVLRAAGAGMTGFLAGRNKALIYGQSPKEGKR